MSNNQTQQPQQSNGGQQPAGLQEVIAGYRSQHGDTDYLREVTQIVSSEIGVKYLDELRAEFSKANVLAYRKEGEIDEAVNLVRFRTNQFLAEHPPEGSKMTGDLRQLVYGDANEPMTKSEVREIQALEQVLIARILQSRDMEQQRIIKEMRQDQHLTREDNNRSKSLGDKVRDAFR